MNNKIPEVWGTTPVSRKCLIGIGDGEDSSFIHSKIGVSK